MIFRGGGGKVSSVVENSIKAQIKTALLNSKREIEENISIMKIGVQSLAKDLSNEAKESLAQDTDLIEEFRQRSELDEKTLSRIACRVDSKYGRGARYRDNLILATSILGSAAAVGIAKIGLTGFTSSITGASAIGAFSLRTAGVLRVVASLEGGAAIFKEVETNCFSKISLRGSVSEPKKCENNLITSLGKDKCTLNVVLAALGGKAVYKGVNLGKREIQEGVFAWDRAIARGPRAEALAIEASAGDPSIRAENSKLLKSFNASAPSRRQVNSPITTSLKAQYDDSFPQPMRDKIVKLKSRIDKIEFDPPILARKNGYTNADTFEKPEDFLPGDLKMSQGLLNSFSDLHNKQKFADYLEDLLIEVAKRMIASGDPGLKTKAIKGVIDQ